MKKLMKIFAIVTVFLFIIPAIAGIVVTLLWNSVVTVSCGFSMISFWQGIGFFLLGQLMSAGFVLALFFCGCCLHHVMSRHHHDNWRNHWHNMTDEERREFILRRREHFGFYNRPQNGENVTK